MKNRFAITMEEEIWKPYPILPKRFMVSDYGRILSLHTMNFLKTSKDKYGYERIAIIVGSRTDKTRKHVNLKVHRMVAETFLPKEGKDTETVNHRDGNKSNNKVDNLEWCSFTENTLHAHKNGVYKITEETRRKLSLKAKGRKQTPEWIQKRIQSRFKKGRVYGI